jgi:23S rRNA pseudouridine2605 synthase
MGDATGFRVMRLARVGFAGVTTEGLRPGAWRYLNGDELTDIKKEFGVPRRIVHPPIEPPKPAGRPERRPERRPEGHDRNPRYGGGSPARRDLGVREDWGGGIRRGSSGTREEDDRPPPRGDLGGSERTTRTTGTGGGIRAGKGSFRGKRR